MKSIWVIGLLVGAVTTTGWADDPRAEKLYGDGVHAFYRADYSRAIRNFDLATGYGSQDPRVFYFRGVAKSRQGRVDEARFDFQYGAQLEANQGRTDVGRSLQRVQGRDRIVLEQYRRQARRLVQSAPRPAPSVNPPADVAEASPAEPQIVRKPVSEIPEPLRSLPADPQDPFAEQASGMLGRGDLQQATAETDPTAEPMTPPAIPADGLAGEGQAEITGDEMGEDVLGADDPFSGPSTPVDSTAAEDDPFGDASPFDEGSDAPQTPAPDGGSGRGAFGAVFRALTRGATSNPTIKQGQELLDSARGALPGGGPAPMPPDPQEQDTPLDNNAPADDAAEEDLFDDPFAETADEPAPVPADDAQPADSLDDPFVDDPFADEEVP